MLLSKSCDSNLNFREFELFLYEDFFSLPFFRSSQFFKYMFCDSKTRIFVSCDIRAGPWSIFWHLKPCVYLCSGGVRFQSSLISFSHTNMHFLTFNKKSDFTIIFFNLVPKKKVLGAQKIVLGPVLITGRAMELVRGKSVH